METESSRLKDRMETMNLMIDEIQEKLYEFEQNKKNNLIFHGILADHPETSDGLNNKITSLIKAHVSIKREMPITKASRVYSGPEVRGTRPVLVTFESFKDRDEVLRKVCQLCTFQHCVSTGYSAAGPAPQESQHSCRGGLE